MYNNPAKNLYIVGLPHGYAFIIYVYMYLRVHVYVNVCRKDVDYYYERLLQVSKSCVSKIECSPANVGCVPIDTQKVRIYSIHIYIYTYTQSPRNSPITYIYMYAVRDVKPA